MKLTKSIIESNTHVIIVGRSGSGKTHTVARIIEALINYRRKFILLDWSGEYSIHGFGMCKPVFSYPLLRNSLAEVMSEMIRLQSQTAGTWTYDSVAKTIEESEGFEELLEKLRENSEFPVRDSGAKAAYIRLNMLSKYFADKELKEIPWHVDLSSLDITSRKMALTFYLVQLYNTIIRRQLHSYFLIVEEALNIPENLLKQLLTQLRGYNVRCILVSQEFRDWFLSYNVILHDLGGNNHYLIYKHGVPSQYHKLNIGEVLLFLVEKHKWKKLRVGMPRYVEILPKYQQVQEEESEDNVEENLENGEGDDVGDEEVQGFQKVEAQNVEEQGNLFKNEESFPSDPRLDRILEEHRILSKEINDVKYTLNTLEGAVAKLSEEKRNDDVDARLLGLGNDIAMLNSKIEELSEKLNGLENYVTKTFSEIMERLGDLERKADYVDKYVEGERSLVADVSLSYTGKRDMLKFMVEANKIIVRPADYLGREKFKLISNELFKHGYKLDRDGKNRLYWHKTMSVEAVNNT